VFSQVVICWYTEKDMMKLRVFLRLFVVIVQEEYKQFPIQIERWLNCRDAINILCYLPQWLKTKFTWKNRYILLWLTQCTAHNHEDLQLRHVLSFVFTSEISYVTFILFCPLLFIGNKKQCPHQRYCQAQQRCKGKCCRL